MNDPATDRVPPTSTQIFTGFLRLSLIGFGGVLPLGRRMLVDQTRWLTGDEFAEMLAFCQVLPGGNFINMVVVVGMRFRGVPGALAAFFGLMAVPTVAVLALGLFYNCFRDEAPVRHMIAGLAAAAAGLLLAMTIQFAAVLRGKWVGIAVAAICFVLVALLRLPLLLVMAVLVPASIALAGRNA